MLSVQVTESTIVVQSQDLNQNLTLKPACLDLHLLPPKGGGGGRGGKLITFYVSQLLLAVETSEELEQELGASLRMEGRTEIRTCYPAIKLGVQTYGVIGMCGLC